MITTIRQSGGCFFFLRISKKSFFKRKDVLQVNVRFCRKI